MNEWKFMKQPNRITLVALIFSSILLFAGLIYLSYLNFLFPRLIPGYGGGEPFHLDKDNNYTTQFPWFAYTKLYLTIQANETVHIYINDSYVCNCSHYELTIEPNRQALIKLISSSAASGRFTAHQEIPWERQLIALGLSLFGFISTVFSTTYWFWLQNKHFT